MQKQPKHYFTYVIPQEPIVTTDNHLQLGFEAVRGHGPQSDYAIDEFSITVGSCNESRSVIGMYSTTHVKYKLRFLKILMIIKSL